MAEHPLPSRKFGVTDGAAACSKANILQDDAAPKNAADFAAQYSERLSVIVEAASKNAADFGSQYPERFSVTHIFLQFETQDMANF